MRYVTPGILLMTIAGGHRDGGCGRPGHDRRDNRPLPDDGDLPSVDPGRHVIGSVIQTVVSLVVVLAVAVLVGFRPTATVVEWLAAAGVLC